MKRGFTLIELLVVIGIIGILAGVLFSSLSGGSESARATRCLTNMRNLATASQAWGSQGGNVYPLAGSLEYTMYVNTSQASDVKRGGTYATNVGWINWDDRNRSAGGGHQSSKSWLTSMYCDDSDTIRYVMQSGTLWKYVGGNKQTYICPLHVKRAKYTPNWSYLMNANFHWDEYVGEDAYPETQGIGYGELKGAERVLLFGEIPFTKEAGLWADESREPGTDFDCTLQFDNSVKTKTGWMAGHKENAGKYKECIGFNHKSGKMTFANVVFADGHVEKLRVPPGGLTETQRRELTAWLCMGVDVSFNGKKYECVED